MHILITDVLTCPRCGPEFGLILLAREVRDRRVLEGRLGCFNCREEYPVTGGFGDLRFPPADSGGSGEPEEAEETVDLGKPEELEKPEETGGVGEPESRPDPASSSRAVQMAALLGVTEGPALLLLQGAAASQAGAVADLVDEVEVVALDGRTLTQEERSGVSRMTARAALPFYSDSLHGGLLSGRARKRELEEAIRVVRPGGRVVLLEAAEDSRAVMEEKGLEILVEEKGVLVGQLPVSRDPPLVPLRGPDGNPTLP